MCSDYILLPKSKCRVNLVYFLAIPSLLGKWYDHGSYYHMWVKGNDTVMEVITCE